MRAAKRMPYLAVCSSGDRFLRAIQDHPVPQHLNRELVSSWGIDESYFPTLASFARKLGLTNPTGKPSPVWRTIASTDNPEIVFRRTVQACYQRLLRTMPEAAYAPRTELRDWFMRTVRVRPATADLYVRTFRMLTVHAGLRAWAPPSRPSASLATIEQQPNATPEYIAPVDPSRAPISIGQLVLQVPVLDSQAGYEQFFRALRKELYG